MNTQINFYGCCVHCTKLFQFCMHLYQTRGKDVVYLSELNISIEPIFGEHFCQKMRSMFQPKSIKSLGDSILWFSLYFKIEW